MTESSNVSSLPSGRRVGEDIRLGLRVNSKDYGDGTVVHFSPNGVMVHWDSALEGTRTHLLEHDRSYVEDMQRLEQP